MMSDNHSFKFLQATKGDQASTSTSLITTPLQTRFHALQTSSLAKQEVAGKHRLPLVGNYMENILSGRMEPVSQVDGYRAEVRSCSSLLRERTLNKPVRVNFLSRDQNFPYTGKLLLGQRGFRMPRKGTLQVTLFNPLGKLERLFLLAYDLADMPAGSQTFLRQRTVLAPKDASLAVVPLNLIQLNLVTSNSGHLYLHKDVRFFVSKRLDLEAALQLNKQHYDLKSSTEMPKNPRYYTR